uniref:Uncharacterized protein n=1 Tax=Tetradesmus obliquus TaxID=3088 RepID=A0A383WJX1_TETOB
MLGLIPFGGELTGHAKDILMLEKQQQQQQQQQQALGHVERDMAGATVGSYIISRALKYNMAKRLVLLLLLPLLLLLLLLQVTWRGPL